MIQTLNTQINTQEVLHNYQLKDKNGRDMNTEELEEQLDGYRKDIQELHLNCLKQGECLDEIISIVKRTIYAENKQDMLREVMMKLKKMNDFQRKVKVKFKNPDALSNHFYQNMKRLFPDLSNNEVELCAFIKLNMSNKDIAVMKNTTSNTINVAKHRIKKKLNVSDTRELEALIYAL